MPFQTQRLLSWIEGRLPAASTAAGSDRYHDRQGAIEQQGQVDQLTRCLTFVSALSLFKSWLCQGLKLGFDVMKNDIKAGAASTIGWYRQSHNS